MRYDIYPLSCRRFRTANLIALPSLLALHHGHDYQRTKVSILSALVRALLYEADGAVYIARAMVVFENIEPEPVSTKVAEHLVNDRSQDLPTEAKVRLGNHDPLQFKRTVRGRQAAQLPMASFAVTRWLRRRPS